jgi:hypothetical protein
MVGFPESRSTKQTPIKHVGRTVKFTDVLIFGYSG